jgi:general stress protein 26
MSEKLQNFKAEVWRRFNDYQHVFLATEESNQPRVRPVTLVNFDQKFWVLTGTDSAKVRQIHENPRVEFCLLFEEGEHQGYIRASGLAKIIKDRETKVKLANHCHFFNEHWKSCDDPNYTLLELKLDEIEYLGLNEEIARKFKL